MAAGSNIKHTANIAIGNLDKVSFTGSSSFLNGAGRLLEIQCPGCTNAQSRASLFVISADENRCKSARRGKAEMRMSGLRIECLIESVQNEHSSIG
jgi:ribosomal protein S27E